MVEKKKDPLETTMPAIPENVNRRPGAKWKPLFETDASRERLNMVLLNMVIQGKLDKVKELVEKGADPNAKDDMGRSALKWAKFIGHKEVAEFLESKGARENAD